MNDLPDIVKVIEHYGGTVRQGVANQTAVKCPFHNDTHASAGVNRGDNLFNCLTCGVGGNSLQIIAQREGISIREAVTFAEGITGESHSQLRDFNRPGGSLPRKSWHNKSGSAPGAVRRSLES